ncbi:MAG: hypothetical protein ACSW8E_02520 [Clostridia bacterium]
MAREIQQKLPAARPERSLSFERLSGGLNLWELDYRLRRSESPEMKNLMWRDGALNCRDGQVWLDDTARGSAWAITDKPFHGRLVYHAGDKLYAWRLQEKTLSVLLGNLPQNAGSFFRCNEDLFYKNKGAYIRVSFDAGTDELQAAAVTAYTPVTLINADPDDGAGDLYQPENRLSAEKTVWYNAKSGVSVYHLPVRGIDGVTRVTVDGAVQESTAYTVDAAAGTVTFQSAPPVSTPAANNTVCITYAKANPEAYSSVMDCRCAAVCGGTGALCVVLAGSEAQPNAYFWNGSHNGMDPGYFPMPQFQLAGDSSDPITAFGKQQSYLVVLKANSLGRTAVSETKIDGRATLDMPFVPINSELGCDRPGTLCLVENNLVWAHSRHGVLRLRDSSAAYENNVVCISRKINGGGAVQGLLEDLKDGPACACDDGHRYLLAAGGHAWVWDYELSEPGDPSWFYWTEIGARAFAVDGERICHLDAQGRLSAFERVYADYGRAIEKVYRFATEHFGGYDRLKNVHSVVLVMRSDTNATASLTYITDHERRKDRSELRAWSWMLVPRNLSFRSLHGRGFASVFRRSCRCRGVRHFTMRLSNDRVGQDLSVVSAQVFYNYQGRQR